MDVMMKGASLAALGNFTTSHFTQEGAGIPRGDADPASARVAAVDMAWAGGINQYVKILEDWGETKVLEFVLLDLPASSAAF
ncbi:hypothetical protein N7448_009189 [Penicillium atrosanguineum]|uniref:Uncharacterized protein n=1 Tax=Penicillium atrosanguineum TaxID=1132637 RepID=A0A9W9U811_9EURO|nr:major facilitator superfamily domain-containing protein [Penicillium atrosanguineum]KAJ5123092.1 hypothetical protein N7448_009189 [Penicillium atrosanguineum]KAJ5141723.1 hypothetical protein N7526_002718 [Penicillium atrosanguineum]KAJ5298317.1 major facilitator superfamily domain-containing protein [Penicillium atrosanguineum]KAJ5321415.1 hypothetical protein N7476_004417 [Penicillium atrosanguineum]